MSLVWYCCDCQDNINGFRSDVCWNCSHCNHKRCENCHRGEKIEVEPFGWNVRNGKIDEKEDYSVGKLWLGGLGATTSVLIADDTARNYVYPAFELATNMTPNIYTDTHQGEIMRCVGCLSVYTGCATALYRNGNGCKYRDVWVISGICGGMILGLCLGRELENILLQILPWTVLISLICSNTICHNCD